MEELNKEEKEDVKILTNILRITEENISKFKKTTRDAGDSKFGRLTARVYTYHKGDFLIEYHVVGFSFNVRVKIGNHIFEGMYASGGGHEKNYNPIISTIIMKINRIIEVEFKRRQQVLNEKQNKKILKEKKKINSRLIKLNINEV